MGDQYEFVRKLFREALPDIHDRGLLIREWGLSQIGAVFDACVALEDDPVSAFKISLEAKLEDLRHPSGSSPKNVAYDWREVAVESLEFNAPIEPIPVTQHETILAEIPFGLLENLQREGILVVGDMYDSDLSWPAVDFMRMRTFESTENALHARNDGLLEVMASCARLPIVRNATSDGTTHLDRFDACIGQPPIIFLEEKRGGPLRIPEQEVVRKVAWIPQYSRLGALVGIGIAGNQAGFFLHTVQGRAAEARFDLSTVPGRGRALRAAINVGSWSKQVLKYDLLGSTRFGFNCWNKNNRRDLNISMHFVTKRYKSLSKNGVTNLRSFYRDTAGIAHLEQATFKRKRSKTVQLALELREVGEERHPKDVAEVKAMVKGILEALAACHHRGWCINDLRLSNVVILANSSWQIIDAEMARKGGSDFPEITGKPAQSTCSPGTDLLMLSQMLNSLAKIIPFDKMLKKMQTSLKQQKHGAAELLCSEDWKAIDCHGRRCASC